MACGWMREEIGIRKKKNGKRDMRGCGSAALEKKNRWIGRLVVWLLYRCVPAVRLSGQPRIFKILRGPGTGGVWVVRVAGCAVC